jgi:small subunit ribosomal protein S16
MLVIRLQRVGRKKVPIFRVVVTDRRNAPRSGKSLEFLGAYDPREGGIRQFNGERVRYWLSVGAQPTDTVYNLLVREKIISGKKIDVLPKKKIIKQEAGKAEEQSGDKKIGDSKQEEGVQGNSQSGTVQPPSDLPSGGETVSPAEKEKIS